MPPQAILRLCLMLSFISYILAHPLHQGNNAVFRRGLGGLFGDEDDSDDLLVPSGSEMNTVAFPQPPRLPIKTTEGIGEIFTAEGKQSKASSATSLVSSSSRSAAIASTLDSQASSTQVATSTASRSVPSSTSTIPATREASNTAEATQWKVVGILTIGIALVAGVLLSIVYFDLWWGFLLALVGKRKEDGGTEDMVPDWTRRDWEFKVASEDGHRYPTLSSLEAMTKNKESPSTTPKSPDPHSLMPTRPPSIYLPDLDPHPLEPLFRRPSASNHPALRSPT